MAERIKDYEVFWAYYLYEHRDPRSRWLHLLGTTGWLTCVGLSVAASPLIFPAAFAVFGGAVALGLRKGEGEGPNWAHMAVAVLAPSLAAPLTFPAGVVFAYAMAWTGHFIIEKNRPATFKYPLWSFVSDFRMLSHMLRGRLWTGDPLVELGLTSRVPSAV